MEVLTLGCFTVHDVKSVPIDYLGAIGVFGRPQQKEFEIILFFGNLYSTN